MWSDRLAVRAITAAKDDRASDLERNEAKGDVLEVERGLPFFGESVLPVADEGCLPFGHRRSDLMRSTGGKPDHGVCLLLGLGRRV
jgi:hypothetical protein